MQIGVYSLVAPDLDVDDAADLFGRIGYTGVEWTVDYQRALWDGKSNWHIDSTNQDASVRRVRKASERNGLSIICLGARCKCTELDAVRRHLEIAAKVGARSIRIFAPAYDGSTHFDTLLEQARSACAAIEKTARETGVQALLEVHNGAIDPSASATWRILDGFDPKHVAAIFDPGNMIREGLETWKMAIEILGRYLVHVHVKNGGWFRGEDGKWAVRDMSLADGMVDWPRVIGFLKGAGYDDFLSIEDFRPGWGKVSAELPTAQKLQEDYDYLKALI